MPALRMPFPMSNRIPKCLTAYIAILSIAILSASVPAFSWETDVHLGLTEWLSLKKGFAKPYAQALAEADQELDASPYTDAVYASAYIAVTGDAGAAEMVRDLHFPSNGRIPGDPRQRAVKPDSD